VSWKASGKDTIGDVIAANTQACPDKVAVHFDSGGISFGELDHARPPSPTPCSGGACGPATRLPF